MVLGALELLMLAILTLFGVIGVGIISFVVWYSGKAAKDYSGLVARKTDQYVSWAGDFSSAPGEPGGAKVPCSR